MPSVTYTVPAGSIWFLVGPVDNDGYCTSVGTTTVVCRAWATGLT